MKNFKKLFIIFIFIFTLCLIACSSNTYSIHTNKQAGYLNDKYDQIGSYADGTKELSRPLPITLKVKNYGEGTKLLLSETENFNDYIEYDVTSSSMDIYNLKIHTTYYYKTTNGDKESNVKTFNVEDNKIRNLYIDGVTNVRDVGGMMGTSTYVKQGMLIRSAKFNKDESTELVITNEGINALVNVLKVKTEIDLRTTEDNESGNITESPLGNSVKYISLPFESSGNILVLNKNQIKALFDILADINNYPIVFHCSIGTDRTGLVSFIINAIMGVCDEDLYRDYLFSNFGEIGSLRAISGLEKYYFSLDAKQGNTTKEKMINYLLDIGVTNEKIQAVISIMTE